MNKIENKKSRKSTSELLGGFYRYLYGDNYDKYLLNNTHFASLLGFFLDDYKSLFPEKVFVSAINKFISGKDKYHRFLAAFTTKFDKETKSISVVYKKYTYLKFTFAPDKISFNMTLTPTKNKIEVSQILEGEVFSFGTKMTRSEQYKIKPSNKYYKMSKHQRLCALGLDQIVSYLNNGETISPEDIAKFPINKYSRIKYGTIYPYTSGESVGFALHMRGEGGKTNQFNLADINSCPIYMHTYICTKENDLLNTLTGEPDDAKFVLSEEQLRECDNHDKKDKYRLFDPLHGTEATETEEKEQTETKKHKKTAKPKENFDKTDPNEAIKKKRTKKTQTTVKQETISEDKKEI